MAVLGGKLEGTARGLLTVGRQIDAQTLARPMPSRRAIAAGPSSSSRRSRRTSTANCGSPAETIDRSRARSGATGEAPITVIIAGSESFHASYLLASYLLAASLYKIDDDIRLGSAARAPVRGNAEPGAATRRMMPRA